MSVIDQLATARNIRGDEPNKELARRIAAEMDKSAVTELVAGLKHPNPAINSDCIKVLYEIGYLQPGLIADHEDRFLNLLAGRDNRLIWGGMIAIATIAAVRADTLFLKREQIIAAIAKGSVITVDAGIRALARIAAAREEYRTALLPVLFEHLSRCRPKEAPMHAEFIADAVTPAYKSEFLAILEYRKAVFTPAQLQRIDRLIRRLPS